MTEILHRIVWGRNTSSNVMKVLWGLAELGLGFERMLMFATGVSNIRDVIPFARTPGNAAF